MLEFVYYQLAWTNWTVPQYVHKMVSNSTTVIIILKATFLYFILHSCILDNPYLIVIYNCIKFLYETSHFDLCLQFFNELTYLLNYTIPMAWLLLEWVTKYDCSFIKRRKIPNCWVPVSACVGSATFGDCTWLDGSGKSHDSDWPMGSCVHAHKQTLGNNNSK